jgi:hypothetical protein
VDVQKPQSNTRAMYFAFDPNVLNGAGAGAGVTVAAGPTQGRRGAQLYVALNDTNVVRVFDPNTGVPYGDFTVPGLQGTILNMAVNNNDDNWLDIYSVSDLYIVAGDGAYEQVPLVFPGKLDVPAGFNGSHPAP